MSDGDWDRLTLLVMGLAALAAFVRVMVLLFQAPSAVVDASERPVSPFRALLNYWSAEADAQRTYELDKFRIERGVVRERGAKDDA